MANVVRFALSTAKTLYVPGAGTFIAGILDVDANNLALLTKTRYLVQPYRAVELGTVDAATPKPTLPTVPGPPSPDPYPQYLTPAEAASSPELRAAFVAQSRSAIAFPAGTLVDRFPGLRTLIGIDGPRSRYFAANSFTIWEITEPNFEMAQKNRGYPSGVSYTGMGNAKMLWFKGAYYLSAKADSGQAGVYRAANPDPAVEPWVWSSRLVTGTSGTTVMGPAFNTDGNYLYWGEYGSPSGGPRIWRSADGTTWEIVLGPIADGTNHVHGVNADPYSPGMVYATFGDASQLKIMRSTQSGAPGTWTEVPGSASVTWQSVQISFTQDHVYFAADANMGGWTAFRLDKATDRIEHLSHDWHMNVAVPGGRSGRAITDLTFTAGSTTMTSATANFTAADVGMVIRGAHSAIQDNTIIRAVTNATTITVSTAPKGNNGTTTAIITGDLFYGAALMGAVDPATGIYYCVSNDGSAVGNTCGLFAITPDRRLHLLKVLQSVSSAGEVFIANGWGWWGEHKWRLLTG